MIEIRTNLPALETEIADVARVFLRDALILHEHEEKDGLWRETFTLGEHTRVHEAPAVRGGLEEKRFLKRCVKTGCFLLLREVTRISPPWGSLTGIRPTRLLYELTGQGLSPEQAAREIEARYYVFPEKAELLTQIERMQRGVYAPAPDEFDVYAGIPFCTTRCAYCSFSAATLGTGALVEPYLAALFREIEGCKSLANGLRARALYVGGGTPTSLTASQLDRLLPRLREAFPDAREFTVEAGRPDTIDREKLAVLKRWGVTRVSVNPQSFSDGTLRRIGRAHTAEDTLRAFAMTREAGFDDVNMDLIAALPGETEADFSRTLEKTLALAPECVTVHTLAVKRASRLHEFGCEQTEAAVAARMVDEARARLGAAGYGAYYLYRQKYMAGNLENVGYAKPGRQCLYNIGNMEETAPVLALGAGAITKWLFPRERRIERAPNVRNIEEYIDRVDEMLARKRDLLGGNGQ